MNPLFYGPIPGVIITGVFAIIVALIQVAGAIVRELLAYHLKLKQRSAEVPQQPQE